MWGLVCKSGQAMNWREHNLEGWCGEESDWCHEGSWREAHWHRIDWHRCGVNKWHVAVWSRREQLRRVEANWVKWRENWRAQRRRVRRRLQSLLSGQTLALAMAREARRGTLAHYRARAPACGGVCASDGANHCHNVADLPASKAAWTDGADYEKAPARRRYATSAAGEDCDRRLGQKEDAPVQVE